MTDKMIWPKEYAADYWYMRRITTAIRDLTQRLTNIGLERTFAHPLIVRAIPMIEMAADNLGERALSLHKRMPPVRVPGGRPYWVNQTLAQTMRYAPIISRKAHRAKKEYDLHRFAVVGALIEVCRLSNDEIIKKLVDGPPALQSNPIKPGNPEPLLVDIERFLVLDWPVK